MADTIQVLKGSTLTFQSVVEICNPITDLGRFTFTDTLQAGLTMSDPLVLGTDALAEFSIDNGITYNPLTALAANYTATFNATDNLLTVTILGPGLTQMGAKYPILLKITFKATVTDLDAFLNANAPTDPNTLKNTGTFTAGDLTGTTTLGKPANVDLPDTPIEEYSLECCGHSLTVCGEESKNFDAKFCFNCISGEYTNKEYVLTINPPVTGISPAPAGATMTKTDVEIYTDCCKGGTKIEDYTVTQATATDPIIITIPYISKDDDTVDPAQVNMSGECLLVTIPYKIDLPSTCSMDPIEITGSIKFDDVAAVVGSTPDAELAKLGLYVNFDCGDLIGISKTVLV